MQPDSVATVVTIRSDTLSFSTQSISGLSESQRWVAGQHYTPTWSKPANKVQEARDRTTLLRGANG